MERGGDEERVLAETIGWIQRVAVERLDLEVAPGDLTPESKFTELEVTRTGDVLDLDSIDLVEVIEVFEETFATELLENDAFRNEFQEREFTIRNLASFLVKQFELEPGWVRALAGPAS